MNGGNILTNKKLKLQILKTILSHLTVDEAIIIGPVLIEKFIETNNDLYKIPIFIECLLFGIGAFNVYRYPKLYKSVNQFLNQNKKLTYKKTNEL